MSPTKLLEKPDSLLIVEFQEAWSHYRHLETTRVQYLGFFFTIVFGVLGFAIAILRDIPIQNPSWIILGLFTFVWLLFMLTVLLYTSVKKLGIVLRHYENVMKQVRMRFYPNNQNIDDFLNVRQVQHPVMKIKIFSIQNTTEYIFIASCIILTVVQIVGVLAFSQSNVLFDWQIWVMGAYAATMVMMMFYVVIIPVLRTKAQNRKK